MAPFIKYNVRVAFVMGDKDNLGNMKSGKDMIKFINSYSKTLNLLVD